MTGGERTVIDVLERVARTHADVDAYVDGARRVSYGELAARSAGVAQFLRDLGVRRGDVVAIRLPASIEYALAYLAALRLGAVATGINPRLGRREVEGITMRAAPVAHVVDDSPVDSSGPVLTRADIIAAEPGDPFWRPVDLSPTDPVAIVWTSGTTGLPKGAVFDHGHLEALSRATGELSQALDRRLSSTPFAHVGYMTRLWDEIGHAMTSVIVPTPWSATVALGLLESERITVGQGVPTQWELILRQPELAARDLSSLRLIVTGAARVPAALVSTLRRTFQCPVVVRYATTEASVISGTRRDDPPEVVETTVGGPCPTVEVRITDDAGRPQPTGTVGGIEVRSAAMMAGYLGDDQESPFRPDGWLMTGDAGSLDAAGRLHLVGRRSEMYIRGGCNIYPLEVEQILAEHPAVSEVAVAGIADEVLGSRGVAWVVPAAEVPTPSLDALRRWCQAQLADYKAPDRLEIVECLPRNQMGKVDKAVLIDSLIAP